MRDLVVAWGRKRWPGARVVHEIAVGDCRADLGFIDTHHLVLAEIKSSLDTLDRLPKQVEVFTAHAPEVWLALAPKWRDKMDGETRSANKVFVDVDGSRDRPSVDVWGPWMSRRGGQPHIDRSVTVPLLKLLWRDELRAVAERKRLIQGPTSATTQRLVEMLARLLTGQEIIAEACRELRARSGGRMGPAFGIGSDPPR